MMGKILIDVTDHSAQGLLESECYAVFTPTNAQNTGEGFGTQRGFTVRFEGSTVVSLADTDPTWLWGIGIMNDGVMVDSGYYRVTPGEHYLAQMPKVDPASIAPEANPEPLWWIMARSTVSGGVVLDGDLILTRTDGVTINAGRVLGAQGERGRQGEHGKTGEQGIQGNPGDKGDKGDKGDVGERGLQGLPGGKGDKGDKGDQGIQGIPGTPGTVIADTGWTALTPLSPLTGTLEWRCRDKLVMIRFGLTGDIVDGSPGVNAPGSTVPLAYRPVGLFGRGPVYFTQGYNGVAHVGLDGSIGISQKTGATRTGAQGSVAYLIA